MKKKIIYLALVFLITSLFVQANSNNATQDFEDNFENENHPDAVTYQLFPTQNMWTFLKLNTRNGKIWQIQYDVEGDNRFEVYLNLNSLVEYENEVNGRFTLYETQNSWTFILLDQIDGKTWQVQWSFEAENRGAIRIY